MLTEQMKHRRRAWRQRAMQHQVMSAGGEGWSGYSFVNVEAAAISASMLAAGSEPDVARKALIDTTVGALKSGSIWSGLDTFYMLAAHSAAGALINWKNPGTYDAIAVNAPTFEANRGYTGDGSTSRLRTQFTPSTHGVNTTLNDASAAVWVLNNVAADTAAIGNSSSPRTSIGVRSASDGFTARINIDSNALTGSSTDSRGLFHAQRRGAADLRLFKNGSSVGTGAQSSTALAGAEQWICGANAALFSTHQIACALWGASLTGLESALHTALYNYLHDSNVGAV